MSTMSRVRALTAEQVAHFRSRLEPVPDTDGCLAFTGYTDTKGHGRVSLWVGGKVASIRAHRLALALAKLEAGEDVDEVLTSSFECGTEGCCNPDHLGERSHAYYITEHVKPKPTPLAS